MFWLVGWKTVLRIFKFVFVGSMTQKTVWSFEYRYVRPTKQTKRDTVIISDFFQNRAKSCNDNVDFMLALMKWPAKFQIISSQSLFEARKIID